MSRDGWVTGERDETVRASRESNRVVSGRDAAANHCKSETKTSLWYTALDSV